MISDLDFDLKKFGNILYKIRKSGKSTQASIREISGIHPDTIKNIEYGRTLPSTDVLNRLGEFYNINLFNILERCRFEKNDFIDGLVKQLDLLSYNDDLTLINQLIKELDDYINHNNTSFTERIQSKISQLRILFDLIKIKNKTDIMNVRLSEELATDALKINHANFSVNKLTDNYYSILEYRILLLLSFSKTRQKDHDIAIYLTRYAIKNLEHHLKSNIEVHLLLIQSYFNLCYQLFLTEQDEEVIVTCNNAILLSQKYFNFKFLPNLYYRKGISEFLTDKKTYLGTLIKCLQSLDLLDETPLKEKYVNSLREQYNIDLSKS